MAENNKFQGQLRGPFAANEELFEKITEQCISRPKYIAHIGIQTEVKSQPTLIMTIDHNTNQEIEIGNTGMYEIGNTKITSIKFLENKDNNTIIDYTVVL